mmetsp:Transcript_70499/g.131856  ORF Transcript_70499/g.131856 Transcript_70499/m.131856 type:complete len:251 (+) Transcript_70499:951-1703(+)
MIILSSPRTRVVIACTLAIVVLQSMICAPWRRSPLAPFLPSTMLMVLWSAISTVICAMSSIFVFSILWRRLVVRMAAVRMLIGGSKVCPFSILTSTPSVLRADEHGLLVPFFFPGEAGLTALLIQVLVPLWPIHWCIISGTLVTIQLCLQTIDLVGEACLLSLHSLNLSSHLISSPMELIELIPHGQQTVGPSSHTQRRALIEGLLLLFQVCPRGSLVRTLLYRHGLCRSHGRICHQWPSPLARQWHQPG